MPNLFVSVFIRDIDSYFAKFWCPSNVDLVGGAGKDSHSSCLGDRCGGELKKNGASSVQALAGIIRFWALL